MDAYDLVLSDFEPITAWAAKLSGKPCIGLGHQYAFNYPIPQSGSSIIYPDVAQHISAWIYQGQWRQKTSLVRDLWQQTEAENNAYFGSIPVV